MTYEEFTRRYTSDPRTDSLGDGGFGSVYRATDNLSHRQVAIKVARVRVVNGKEFSLRDEFNALQGLPMHPNIANYEELYSFERMEGIFDYAVMQYYPDGNLAGVIGNPLSLAQKEDIATQLLDGISFLHAHNVVHRDLKPGNILVVKQNGRVIPVITDFGLSKIADLTDSSLFNNSVGGVYTPKYASPEQLQGKPMRLNTDLWSYGVIVYELFTGEQLFAAGGSSTAAADRETYNLIVSGDTRGRLAKLPAKWRRVLERCLVADPTRRVKSAEELQAMIKATPGSGDQGRETVTVPDNGFPPQDASSRTVPSSGMQTGGQRTLVDKPTSREPFKPEPAHSGMASPRNPRKADPQNPVYSSRKRKIPVWAWIVGGVAVVALLVWLMLPKARTVESIPDVSVVSSEDGEGNYNISVGGVDFTMKKVKGGTFTMGCTSEQGDDCWDNEKPSHSVTLSDYWIGEAEVTQALWQAVMGSNPSYFNGDNLPVEYVSWDDCQEFIRELNRITGLYFRLPTEAEWEYAARGGNKESGYKYAGGNTIGEVAWYSDNSGDQTHPVKGKKPNALGLYDMSGNVWEWCSDWYGDYSSSSQTDPEGPSSGSYCVLRGGSWYDYARGCRVSDRTSSTPSYRDYFNGFRLVLVHQ